EEVPLRLDADRLAVRFAEGVETRDALAVASASGLDAASAEPTPPAGWYHLTLRSPLVDWADARNRISALLASPRVLFAAPVLHGFENHWVTVTPTVLLRFRPEHRQGGEGVLAEVAPELRLLERDFGGMAGAYRLGSEARDGFEVLASADRLARDPRVEWAEPDWLMSARALLIPNDPGFPYLWGMMNTGQFLGTPGMDMDADLAWDLTTGSASTRVLIMDSGIDPAHPDLNQVPGADFTGQGTGGAPGNVCDWHGTSVAGCVSAILDNGLGTVGIAPDCPALSARVLAMSLACNLSGAVQASWIVDALGFGLAQGARVSNASLGLGFASSALEAQYQSTYDAGMVHFAAAGNGGFGSILYPASIPVVNAVSGLAPSGTLTSFSQWGPGTDFSAPAVFVYTTDMTGPAGLSFGDYAFPYGTSFASPYAAGVAALVVSQNPTMTSREIELAMRAGRDLGAPGYDTTYGWGFVNANSALRSRPFGAGTAGSGGAIPELFVTGLLTIGSPVALRIENGLGGAVACLAAGIASASIPALGGTLFVQPPVIPIPATLGGNPGTPVVGTAGIGFTIPNDPVLQGLHLFFQAGLVDPGAGSGVALTNGLDLWIG
ncbi:MAG TPA: S8 family serine peptidase, partial [Planctomycetota bacterium]|nr:S8 family serine peptidase [Planctomycetota bacterium]